MAKSIVERVMSRVMTNLVTKQVQGSIEGKLTKPQIRRELQLLSEKYSGQPIAAELDVLLKRF